MCALFLSMLISFFLFNNLKRERVRGGRHGNVEKRRRRVEKSGVPVDAIFNEINDLGQKTGEIHEFLDVPVPTCRKARPASVGR